MSRILGIETSCDETAAAIVVDGRHVESNVVASQDDVHRETGGVVPEIASRLHLRAIRPVVTRALEEAGRDWGDLDLVAVTHGPGLAGALLVGLNTAKALSYARGLPLLGVNHLEGHVYANWLVDQVEPRFPLVCLIVSGGHSDLVLMREHGEYARLGRTLDDAAGEAFDKAARMMGLGYPGGPAVQQAAEGGDPSRYTLPRAWLRPSWDFSFSGLKTAVLRTVREAGDGLVVADLAASFQEAVVDVLATKTIEAARDNGAQAIALAGGVAANLPLRARIQQLSAQELGDVPVLIPPVRLCTDNAAMIAAAAHFRFAEGATSPLDLDVFPVLPIA
ncbi:MAG TPA: tRNA (adenosine(37)-N6)-threonylcarbamoyltransferase complex transferase subunit TsaD [Chloroflexota bacterium]|nr:tRNA (adenosine(37)-N6)-threonylcarbamoyltransferase complex transferase subunit TsaD [Chloroflexota bacterium]